MSDYSRGDLKKALDGLPLLAGDVVFCHANIGYFGKAEGVADADTLCRMFFDAIMERIGSSGTLCVPTFTYSFPRGETFDSVNTPSRMGAFAEWVRKQPDAKRLADPCYSIAGIGKNAGFLLGEAAENSFDLTTGSFFGRFWWVYGKVLNLNFDAGSTFVHWVERKLRVPYRFDKTFDGTIWDGGVPRHARSTIWVRYLDDALEARFEAFDALARERGLFHTAKLGRGAMGVISTGDTYSLIEDTLPSRPWFLTMAEAMGVEPDPLKFSALR